MYKVYVKQDEQGRIVQINSDAFLHDTEGWVQIDEGEGDRYHHAQGNYFPQSIVTIEGVYRYKLVGGKVKERTEEEIQADIDALPPPPPSAQSVNNAALLTFRLLAKEDKFTNEELLENKEAFPYWRELIGKHVEAGTLVQHNDGLFKVKEPGHVFSAEWEPGVATASLFGRVSKPGQIEAWVPGSYNQGVQVSHNGFLFTSMVDNNIYEPGSPGVYDNVWRKDGPA